MQVPDGADMQNDAAGAYVNALLWFKLYDSDSI